MPDASGSFPVRADLFLISESPFVLAGIWNRQGCLVVTKKFRRLSRQGWMYLNESDQPFV